MSGVASRRLVVADQWLPLYLAGMKFKIIYRQSVPGATSALLADPVGDFKTVDEAEQAAKAEANKIGADLIHIESIGEPPVQQLLLERKRGQWRHHRPGRASQDFQRMIAYLDELLEKVIDDRIEWLSRLRDASRIDADTFISEKERSTSSALLSHYDELKLYVDVLSLGDGELSLEDAERLKSWADQKCKEAEEERRQRTIVEEETRPIPPDEPDNEPAQPITQTTPYAFDNFRSLVSALQSPVSNHDPVLRYVCALVAELAYCHVPKFEIDNQKRAMVVPCEMYQDIVARRVATDVTAYLQELDFSNPFVVVDRGVIAVGLLLNRHLFIGFRGTRFLFDWRINLRAPLVDGPHSGRVHRGFAEEAMRISAKIDDTIKDKGITNVDHLFLTGHSLGGAVAALSSLRRFGAVSTIIFGAPRYCDVTAHLNRFDGPPTQITRTGDIVPSVPPRSLGYADHPYEFGTSGSPITRPFVQGSALYFIWRMALFLGKLLEPHFMEMYRRELGATAKVPFSAKLAPYEKLTAAQVR